MNQSERLAEKKHYSIQLTMAELMFLNRVLLVSNMIGFLLSVYTFMVKWRLANEEGYVAMCDINEHISCSKAFLSQYGKGFGLIGPILGEDSILNMPNYVSGMIFYGLLMILGTVNNLRATKALMWMSLVSIFVSMYLAYILYFVLYDLCLICVVLYGVNGVNFTFAIFKIFSLENLKTKRL